MGPKKGGGLHVYRLAPLIIIHKIIHNAINNKNAIQFALLSIKQIYAPVMSQLF